MIMIINREDHIINEKFIYVKLKIIFSHMIIIKLSTLESISGDTVPAIY